MTQPSGTALRVVSITTKGLGPTYIGTLFSENTLVDWVRIDDVSYPRRSSAGSDNGYRVSAGEGPLDTSSLDIEDMCEIDPDFEERFRREHFVPFVEEYVTEPGSFVRPDEVEDYLERAATGRIRHYGGPGDSIHNRLFARLHEARMPFPRRYFLRWRLFEFHPPHWFDPRQDFMIVISEPEKEHTR